MKTVLRILLLLVLLAVAAIAGYFFIEVDSEEREVLSFVPADFIYAIESDRPTGDWQDLSKTDVWQYLKGNAYFSDLTESADYLDSLLQENDLLVNLVKLGDLTISAHTTQRGDYDFLILIDLLGKGSKLPKLKPVMVQLFKNLEYEVRTDTYFNIDLYHLYDAETKETLVLSAVDNVMIISYTEALVKKAIEQSEKVSLAELEDFQLVRGRTDRDELYTLYLNYERLDEYMGIYTNEVPEMLVGLEDVVTYSAFDLKITDDEVDLDGYLKQKDSVASYLNVFKDVGKGSTRAGLILPSNTATFTSLGFEDFANLYRKFDAQYESSDPEGYKTLASSRKLIENRLKIEFERDFFDWMTDEVVTAIVPKDTTGKEYAYYAMLHFDDFSYAKERLNYVTKRIGKTPVKFEELDYQGYTIKYLKLKGFFNLFFKKLFAKIEKPHFTFVDDYVVFSNDTTSLQVMIDAYLAQDVLDQQESFEDFTGEFDRRFNVFTYINSQHFYGYLNSSLDAETSRDLRKNREYMLSFPQIGFQISPAAGMYEAKMKAEFVKPEEPSDH
ncbi:MAG: DUF3352 domain-containing protein [Bacteroidota bacterium]